jgi:hypothetical protein
VAEPRGRSEMFADFLREAAVLVLVFGPLDYLVSKPFTLLWFGISLGASAVICALLLWWGMTIEVRRSS